MESCSGQGSRQGASSSSHLLSPDLLTLISSLLRTGVQAPGCSRSVLHLWNERTGAEVDPEDLLGWGGW